MSHFSLPPMSSISILLETTARCFSSYSSDIFDLLLSAGWMKLSLHSSIFTWAFQQPLGYSNSNLSYKTWFVVIFLVNLQRDWLLCCSEACQLLSRSEVSLQLCVTFCLVQGCKDWRGLEMNFQHFTGITKLAKSQIQARKIQGEEPTPPKSSTILSGIVLSISVRFCW